MVQEDGSERINKSAAVSLGPQAQQGNTEKVWKFPEAAGAM
jgi:hypothetical protein